MIGGIRTGAAGFVNDRRPYRSIRGSLSGTLSAGAIHPALPQEAPAATPTRSITVTAISRSCRNHAVDKPTMPAPTTIAERGSPITDLLDAWSGQLRWTPGFPRIGRPLTHYPGLRG